MPATPQQIANFRADLGSNRDEFPDEEVNNLFDRVVDEFPGEVTKVTYARAVLMGLDQLIAVYARRTSYQQNQSREDISDAVKALERMRPKLAAKLDTAIEEAAPTVTVRFGGWGMPKPRTDRDVPHA